MKNIQLTPQEFPNFIKLAQANKEKYTYTIIGSIIFLTASALFLEKIGF